MSDAETGQVQASAAEIYEQFFVPALFGQWPERLLDAAGVRLGATVLDVGCGTGVLARAAWDRVGGGGAVAGIDRNPAMIEVARRSTELVDWYTGFAERLPFDDGSFDRVVSQFALMFFEDRLAAVREMARVVRRGGTVAVATWAAVDESPGYAAMVDLLRRLFGSPAADALLAPFCLGRGDDLRRSLAAVFPDVRVTRHDGTARFASVEAWVHTEIRGWTLADLIDDDGYARLLTEASAALTPFAGPGGDVSFGAPALFAVASSPG